VTEVRLGRSVLANALALMLGVPVVAPRAWAQDVEQPTIELFDPLVTRNPTPERELEVTVEYEKGDEGEEFEAEVELFWLLGQRFSAGLEIPLVVLMPEEGSDETGLGDITLGGKALLLQSIELPGLLSAGLDLGLPTGSESRGLGGNLSVTPYLAAGIAVGAVDLIGDVAYTWTVDGPDEGIEFFGVSLAAAYKGWGTVTPMLELSILTQTRSGTRDNGGDGEEDEGEEDERVVGEPQVYLTPGVIVSLPRKMIFRTGVQFGLTETREFDYRVIASLQWEF
jgi:hypothetical protein